MKVGWSVGRRRLEVDIEVASEGLQSGLGVLVTGLVTREDGTDTASLRDPGVLALVDFGGEADLGEILWVRTVGVPLRTINSDGMTHVRSMVKSSL